MQAVILAAGKGTRLWPLTSTKPKVLSRVVDTNVLQHNLRQLSSLVEEAILVVGYRGKEIESLIGDNYKGLKITYAWQEHLLGTGDAVKTASPFLKNRFLALNGDDFYFKQDLAKCLERFPSILTKEVDDPRTGGAVLYHDGLVDDIIEKPKEILSNLANIGVYFLDKSIFDMTLEESPRGEYEITDFARHVAKTQKLYFQIAKHWFPGSYPWQLLDINEFLLNQKERKIEGLVDKGCKISGPVVVDDGTIIKSKTIIEGPVFIGKNSIIGPDCYIGAYSSIGNHCQISEGVKIKRSIINDSSSLGIKSRILDSIIGESCILGANIVAENLRPDNKTIEVMVKGKRIDTRREKLGCVLGGNVKIGDGTSLAPGTMVGGNSVVVSGSVISGNIGNDTA